MPEKCSFLPRTLGVAAIIVALIGGLGAGLIVPSFVGMHGVVTSTAVSFSTQTILVPSTVFEGGATQAVTITQTFLDTQTVMQNQTETQTETQPVTCYLTSFSNNYLTVTQLITTTATTFLNSSVTFYHNFQYLYPAKASQIALQTFEFTRIGYMQITFQSAQKIHWELNTYDLTEATPPNETTGIVEFPVAPAQAYTLSIVNDACGPAGCLSSFDVNMTLVYYD